MPHSLTSGMLAEVQKGALMPFLLLEVDTPSGNAYLWTGFGTLSWGGQNWAGAGKFAAVDAIGEINQVQAVGTQYTLNGLDSALLSLALSQVKRYYPTKVYFGCLLGGSVVADPFLIRNARTDTASITLTGDTASITLTDENRLIVLKNPHEFRYTDQDQQYFFPGDACFSMVARIQNITETWGQISQ